MVFTRVPWSVHSLYSDPVDSQTLGTSVTAEYPVLDCGDVDIQCLRKQDGFDRLASSARNAETAVLNLQTV